MDASGIRLSRLTKAFPIPRPWSELLLKPFERKNKVVLDDVTLEVTPGEAVGIFGHNGAGKTTLLRILSTYLLPTSGSVTVGGFDVVREPFQVRRVLGCCLEPDRSFYFRLTGRQNLEFFASLNDLPPEQARQRISEVLRMVGLEEASSASFATYSKGMRQRLALARALLTDPPILMLDEPTQGLDPVAAADFRNLVRESLAGRLRKTILWVTHNVQEAVECCRRALVLHEGRVVFEGAPARLDELARAGRFPGGERKDAS
jgi:ABC-2 type transport system ATP-binding protein